MLRILANRTYRHLFAAQIVALIGTGLATVALGLLAFDLSGERAGLVLGTALAIKMLAYVGLAPVAAALAERLPRRGFLVLLDLIRAVVVVGLIFVTEVWQVYVLIFLLQAASAGFTPAFQATIPDVLPDEAEYTQALSLSRLAYDLENLLSPMLAAALLTVVSFSDLFAGTVIGFLGSAALVLSVTLPPRNPAGRRGFWDRTTRGMRIYLATPRLRGLLALNLAVAAAGAMVIVNTVVIVKGSFGLGETQVALALAGFGGGSMVAALVLPRLLGRLTDRSAMFGGAALLVVALVIGPLVTGLSGLVALWVLAGLGYSTVQTPAGRLLRRSTHPEDRTAIFAAQFALSHACWLLTYPLAGILGAVFGLDAAFGSLAVLALASVWIGVRVWPLSATDVALHRHDTLPPDHPHLAQVPLGAGGHSHAIVIDDWHPRWPAAGRAA